MVVPSSLNHPNDPVQDRRGRGDMTMLPSSSPLSFDSIILWLLTQRMQQLQQQQNAIQRYGIKKTNEYKGKKSKKDSRICNLFWDLLLHHHLNTVSWMQLTVQDRTSWVPLEPTDWVILTFCPLLALPLRHSEDDQSSHLGTYLETIGLESVGQRAKGAKVMWQ